MSEAWRSLLWSTYCVLRVFFLYHPLHSQQELCKMHLLDLDLLKAIQLINDEVETQTTARQIAFYLLPSLCQFAPGIKETCSQLYFCCMGSSKPWACSLSLLLTASNMWPNCHLSRAHVNTSTAAQDSPTASGHTYPR